MRIREDFAARSFARIEREVFIGFYAIRKLLDTFEVSDSTRTMMFNLKWSSCVKTVDYLNAHRIDELFDWNTTATEPRDIEFLCNQFVHSYIFTVVQGEKRELAGFYISSDRTRQKKLYFVSLEQVLTAFRIVGQDYPTKLTLTRDEKTTQWNAIVS